MKSIAPASFMRRILFTLCGVFTATAFAQTPVTVIEYYNKNIAAYFLTGRPAEQASLDGIGDFQRTGVTFVATSATGANAPLDGVCRYRIDVPGSPFSSHFYGLTADCALIASLKLPNFSNEGFDFAVETPAAGVCPASSLVPIYRALRSLTPVDVPNHRYSVSLSAYQEMLTRGWIGEGAVFCAKIATPETPRVSFARSSTIASVCATPRSEVSQITGRAYPDRQGSLDNELQWVRSWSDETYLWFREIPNIAATGYASAATYFTPLKSPALTLSGKPKDKPEFHYTRATSDVESISAGVSYGYGITWSAVRSTIPRQWIAAVVDPGSPADIAGARRGDSIVSIDGVDFVNVNTQAGVNTLNRGLSPPVLGESHVFVVAPASGGANKTLNLASAQLSLQPVPSSGVITTANGKVGYIAFTTFNSFASERAIANAIAGLQTAGITDLVLDLRYNGGGYLYIASQLGYMIAGNVKTNGRTFETLKYNEMQPFGPESPTPFYNVGSGFSGGLASGQALPTLNLQRVFILTSGSTCSASEALVNGLRGIDLEVILIGATTCGKPFGFRGTDNCGTSFFTIQFTGVNAKGEGDYVDGFGPTCSASDDLTKPLGDPTEKQLAAALAYRAMGTCAPAVASKSKALDSASVNSLAVGESSFLMQRGKLLVPAGTARDGGSPINPRSPADFGADKEVPVIRQ